MSDLIDRRAAIEELRSYIVDPKKAISENPDDVFQYNAGIRTAVGVIMELRTSSPWHRVEEPPKYSGKVFVLLETFLIDKELAPAVATYNCLPGGPVPVGTFYQGEYGTITFYDITDRVKYWMPLPEPPKEG